MLNRFQIMPTNYFCTLSSSSSLVTMTMVGQSSSQTILQKSASVVVVGPCVAMYWLFLL